MLTVRATINDGEIEFTEEINLTGEQKVLVTFLDIDVTSVLFPEHDHQEGIKSVGKLHFGLSDREIEVLKLAQQGLTNEQIGEKLEIGHGTVRNYISGVYEKLKVNNRTGAISKALELGLLE